MIQLFNCLCCFVCIYNFIFLVGKCQNVNYQGLYSQDVSNYEIVIPQRVDKDGKFISNLIPHHYKKRSTKESDFIFYKLPIAGEECILQLIPNLKLISPGAVIEIHKKGTERRNTSGLNHEDRFKNLHIKRLKNADCHYSGFIQGAAKSKVALSTCFGLAGFIVTRNGTYTIEPVAESDMSTEDEHPHMIYRNDKNKYNFTICNTLDIHRNRSIREAKNLTNNADVSSISSPLYIETLIVVDRTFLNHHENFEAENYVLTVFNMAFGLFHDASLGFPIKLSLVRIVRLETEDDEMNMNMNQDAIKTLGFFQDWQYRINPGDDSHPNHHDVAIFITKIDIYTNISYGFLGVSTLGSACDKKLSCILCKDNGLRLGFNIAHEIAHLLGAEHDGFNNSCNGLDEDGFRTIMHPQVLLTTETWSKCTQEYIKIFLESGFGECLLDEPSEHHFDVQDLLPGAIYNADYQCQLILNPAARECDLGSTCDSLNCQIPGYLCIRTMTPPAAGTRCGENMWCLQEMCLNVGERPEAIDGNWGEWSSWSECSRTCGSGVSRSERQCNRPVPSHGGKYCVGEGRRHRICSIKPCDITVPSFRDIQCGEFDDWTYPEDGRQHTWREYFYHYENPCVLFCINENLEVVALKPRVIDGTTCYRGIRDICVDGICRSIPCDLNIESNAIEDVCGVCHGDGTTCDFSQGQKFLEKFPKAMTKLITVPMGAKNIKVEEMLPSAARILVRDKETKSFYVRGNKLGMHVVPGSQAWLGMVRSKQEALTIPGPITKPLTIWIERVENVTVKWSMALPTAQQRKPEFTWDFVRWSPCSAICGPGTQKSEPSCIEEKAGLVENSYCADLEIPPTKVRFCEVVKCEPRWMVGDWKDCENSSSSGRVKRRTVHCVRTLGKGEGAVDIIPDEECLPPKPEEKEPCDTRRKRDSSSGHYVVKKYALADSLRNNMAMIRSNRIKFGFHKKYDDYLKHFNAIATPQRKSETIPCHLLDTPHFKNYYRVLQSSEYSLPEHKNVLDVDKVFKDAKKDMKKKSNSLLSQIYKPTFSGNEMNFRSDSDWKKDSEDSFCCPNTLSTRKKKSKVSRRNTHGRVPCYYTKKFQSKHTFQSCNGGNAKTQILPLLPYNSMRITEGGPNFFHKYQPAKRKKCLNEMSHQTKHRLKMKKKYIPLSYPVLNIFLKKHGDFIHRKRSVTSNTSREEYTNSDKKIPNDQSNKDNVWKRIKTMSAKKISDGKLKMLKVKNVVNGKTGDENQIYFQDADKSENERAMEKHREKYAIRFGQVVVDKDDEANLGIIFEEKERNALSSAESDPHSPLERDSVWHLGGEEALKFMQNITMFDWTKGTLSDALQNFVRESVTESDSAKESEIVTVAENQTETTSAEITQETESIESQTVTENETKASVTGGKEGKDFESNTEEQKQ